MMSTKRKRKSNDLIWARDADHEKAKEHPAYILESESDEDGGAPNNNNKVWVEWVSNGTISHIPKSRISSTGLSSRRRRNNTYGTYAKKERVKITNGMYNEETDDEEDNRKQSSTKDTVPSPVISSKLKHEGLYDDDTDEDVALDTIKSAQVKTEGGVYDDDTDDDIAPDTIKSTHVKTEDNVYGEETDEENGKVAATAVLSTTISNSNTNTSDDERESVSFDRSTVAAISASSSTLSGTKRTLEEEEEEEEEVCSSNNDNAPTPEVGIKDTRVEVYLARDNETPRMIAKKFKLNCANLVRVNKELYPSLRPSSKLMEGTSIQISHLDMIINKEEQMKKNNTNESDDDYGSDSDDETDVDDDETDVDEEAKIIARWDSSNAKFNESAKVYLWCVHFTKDRGCENYGLPPGYGGLLLLPLNWYLFYRKLKRCKNWGDVRTLCDDNIYQTLVDRYELNYEYCSDEEDKQLTYSKSFCMDEIDLSDHNSYGDITAVGRFPPVIEQVMWGAANNQLGCAGAVNYCESPHSWMLDYGNAEDTWYEEQWLKFDSGEKDEIFKKIEEVGCTVRYFPNLGKKFTSVYEM